jgi:hypothetical protein
MDLIIDPFHIALSLLRFLGIDYTDVYNERGGVHRSQLMLLNKINKNTGAKNNVYKAIHRLEKSKNPQNIKWARNIENTLSSTIQYGLMQHLTSLSEKDKRETKIKWIPSTAKRPDAVHAKYYGKIMTLGEALKLGLSLRYGCKCSFKVLTNKKRISEIVSKFKKDVFIK